MIDENNYESYFLDFREGNLTEQEIELLMTFLNKNPHLEESLLNFDPYVIESISEISLNKKFLHKSLNDFRSINENNFDEFCIAFYEQDLSKELKQDLLTYIQDHPEKSKDFENYGNVYIHAPLNVTYPYKSKLKRFTLLPIYRIAYIVSAVAAVLMLIIYLLPFTQQLNRINKQTNMVKTDVKSKIQNNVVIANSEVKAALSGKRLHEMPTHLKTKQVSPVSDKTTDETARDENNIASINSIRLNDLKLPINSDKVSLISGMYPINTNNEHEHYLSIKEFAIEKLHKTIDPNLPESAKANRVTWWDLARLGISGINKLTGTEIKMDRKIDEEGEVVAMVIESGKLGYSRSVIK
jgi:hypothetical protein